MKKFRLLSIALFLSISSQALAYERATHEEISERAAQRSQLPEILPDLGIESISSRALNGMNVLQWIRYGANHEDDTLSLFPARYVNHFYNPRTGEGLAGAFYPSPYWGLEDTTAITGQDYSLNDAIEYLYRGIRSPIQQERERYLGLAFRTLGHVVHLIQDAAQPQHTRNDSHGTGSAYERLTDNMRGQLPYDGYITVKFTGARDYWYTILPGGDITAGKGMAEYSNRGFLTVGTNFRWQGASVVTDPDFPLPAFDPSSELVVDITTLIPGTPLRGQLSFFGNNVADVYNSNYSSFNQFATTLSIFDADLTRYALTPSRFFTINRFNCYQAQNYLIPRAVAYSTGLIDYFFRGKLSINVMDDSSQVMIAITNISGSGYPLRNGEFELYYDATDGTRKQLAITSGASVGAIGLADGATQVLTATHPSDLDTSKEGAYVVVYRGFVGSEMGIAVKRQLPRLYVLDGGNRRVQVFTLDGTYIREFASPSPELVAIAVDDRHAYLADNSVRDYQTYAGEVDIHDISGAYVSSVGATQFSYITDIVATEGLVYVADLNHDRVVIYSPDGSPQGSFSTYVPTQYAFHGPSGISVDSQYLYVSEFRTGRVLVFGRTGGLQYLFNSDVDPYQIAVDENYIYVTHFTSYESWITKYTKNGSVVARFGQGLLRNPYGIVVDKQYVYVADAINSRVVLFTKDGQFVKAFGTSGSGPGQFNGVYDVYIH